MSTIYPPEYLQSPPQPPPLPAPPKRRRVRKALLIVGSALAALIALIVVIIVATSGKSTSTVTPTASPTTSATATPTTSATATPTTPSVSQQITAWYNGGGSAQLNAISNDVGTFQPDIQAYVASNLTDGATLQAADATFQADVQAAQANLPPAGIPGFRGDYNAALTYYNTMATDLNNGVIAADSGDYNSAVADIEAGNTAFSKGNAKLNAATADISAYNNS